MNLEIGPFKFSNDFDSANLQSVQLISPQSHPDSTSFHFHDYEVNILTKPDCFGTPFQNGNRTWFYFGVSGPSSVIVKFNILNLNKQVKLFLQGMQPVFRCPPERPSWERISDKLVVNENDEHVCSITFRQRLPEDSRNTLYIAFTYPFSYSDMMDWLNTLDVIYNKTNQTGNKPFDLKNVPGPSRLQMQTLIHVSSSSALMSRQNDIYYHRECACFSLEGRRVELITISSVHGISKEREDLITNLFPLKEERPFKFPSKKVIFVSARVHPGETPSAFVLNGLLKFLLEANDPRATLLRRLFVFKFMPMLNPDGVSRGHYRTDPRGVNLNRMYIQPSPVSHSPIYAAKKLISYYHLGRDTPDDYTYHSNPEGVKGNSVSKENYSAESEPVLDMQPRCCSLHRSGCSTLSCSDDQISLANTPSTSTSKNSLCAGCVTSTIPKEFKSHEIKEALLGLNVEREQDMPEEGTSHDMDIFITTSSEEKESHQCTFESCDEDSTSDLLDIKTAGYYTPTSTSRIQSKKPDTISKSSLKLQKNLQRSLNPDECVTNKKHDIPFSPPRKTKNEKLKQRNSSVNQTHNTPTSDSQSGLYLYIDMHGHATKRGIFMYGNHFKDPLLQADCMLLPRLLAMNCQHFDFSACNFTERLMNMKDRRDGASREGSGRVAVLRTTGLIRSYTLECNYNTGRLVNHISSRSSSLGCSSDQPLHHSSHPPKFTPIHFETIGRGLGESILDLTGLNPWSRLSNTEFNSLDGVRRWLLKRLVNSPEYKLKPNDATWLSPSGTLSKSTRGIDLVLKSNVRRNPFEASTPSLRKGNVILKQRKGKVQQGKDRPLVPKKENLNSSSSTEIKPGGYKTKFCVRTSVTRTKLKSSTPLFIDTTTSVQHRKVNNSIIRKTFKVKRPRQTKEEVIPVFTRPAIVENKKR